MPEQNNNTSGNRRRKAQPVDNSYAHVQPQATEIERAVLGALMIDKDAYAVVPFLMSCELIIRLVILLFFESFCLKSVTKVRKKCEKRNGFDEKSTESFAD